MDIIKEELSEVNALIKVKLTPEDYQENYSKSLKDYGRKVSLPGFRPGKVPSGLIKKKYGPSILAEEINKLLSESVDKFIKDNELQLLGSPMPKDDDQSTIDWENPGEMEFSYEIGISPNFDLKVDSKLKLTYHKIAVDEKDVEDEIRNIRKRYGKMVSAEKAEETDMLLGVFKELDDAGEAKEGGVENKSTISLEFIDNKKVVKSFLGKKAGDEVKINPKDVSKGEADLAAMLNIGKDEIASVGDNYVFIISEIKRIEEAELNQELYDKLFGEGVVTDEVSLKEKVREALGNSFKPQSERLFRNSTSEKIVDKLNLNLPEDFLKRWIKQSNDKPITMEQIEEEFKDYAKSLQWQLIVNKLVKDNEIKVEFPEVHQRVADLMTAQYMQYGIPAPEGKEMDETVARVLQNREEAMRIYEMILEDKLFDFIRKEAKVEEKEVSSEEFTKLAQK
jgi:trigger factor